MWTVKYISFGKQPVAARPQGSGLATFFRVTLKAFISIRMTLGTIQNDYFDYVRHV